MTPEPIRLVIAPPPIIRAAIRDTAPIRLRLGAEQGPPGPPGQSYRHDQRQLAAEWIINHNLGFVPAVTLYTTGSVQVDGAVAHPSPNQARAYFAAPLAGYARCI